MKLVYPLEREYPLTQGFGQTPWASQYHAFGLAGHNGLDLGCPAGTAVLAADDGSVQIIGRSDSGYGRYMVLSHAWGTSLYAHLSQPMLLTGERVSRGQVIALSGSSGNSTGPHLHFEVRPKDEPKRNGYSGAVDPLAWLAPAGELTAEMDAAKDEPKGTQGTYRVRAEPFLNLRHTPSLQAPRLAALYGETDVQVVGAQGAWRKVQLSGWVYAAYLIRQEAGHERA